MSKKNAKTNKLLSVTVENGEYTVILSKNGKLKALRHGEEWRDCCGDGLILALAHEIEELRNKVSRAKNCLVCAAIASPIEVVKNTLGILEEE